MSGITAIVGLVLAGGQAQRLGGRGKTHLLLGRETLLDRTVSRLSHQCSSILLNLPSTNAGNYKGMPTVCDEFAGFEGPLAGLLAGLDWTASHMPATSYVLTTPVDCPFLPTDLSQRLIQRRGSEETVVIAMSGEQVHPLHALWPVRLRSNLRAFLANSGSRKVTAFQNCHPTRYTAWAIDGYDPFFNINTPDDLAYANEIIAVRPEI